MDPLKSAPQLHLEIEKVEREVLGWYHQRPRQGTIAEALSKICTYQRFVNKTEDYERLERLAVRCARQVPRIDDERAERLFLEGFNLKAITTHYPKQCADRVGVVVKFGSELVAVSDGCETLRKQGRHDLVRRILSLCFAVSHGQPEKAKAVLGRVVERLGEPDSERLWEQIPKMDLFNWFQPEEAEASRAQVAGLLKQIQHFKVSPEALVATFQGGVESLQKTLQAWEPRVATIEESVNAVEQLSRFRKGVNLAELTLDDYQPDVVDDRWASIVEELYSGYAALFFEVIKAVKIAGLKRLQGLFRDGFAADAIQLNFRGIYEPMEKVGTEFGGELWRISQHYDDFRKKSDAPLRVLLFLFAVGLQSVQDSEKSSLEETREFLKKVEVFAKRDPGTLAGVVPRIDLSDLLNLATVNLVRSRQIIENEYDILMQKAGPAAS